MQIVNRGLNLLNAILNFESEQSGTVFASLEILITFATQILEMELFTF